MATAGAPPKTLSFDQAVSRYVDNAKKQLIDPVLPSAEHSSIKDSEWHLANEFGLLARVHAVTGAVS